MDEEETRTSKDKIINGKGKRLINEVKERGWGHYKWEQGERGGMDLRRRERGVNHGLYNR